MKRKPFLYTPFFSIFLMVLCTFKSTCAQNYRQLYTATQTKYEDTVKVRALLRLYDHFYIVHTDSLAEGMNLILKAHQVALKINDVNGIIESSYRIAGNLGYFKNESKAIEYYFKGLKYAESSGLLSKTGKAYEGIGLIFYNQKKWDDALQYLKKAIEQNAKYPGRGKKSTPIYLSGLCENERGAFSNALSLLNTALGMALIEKDSNRIYECYLGMAKALSNLDNTPEAIRYYNQCMQYYTKEKASLAYVAIHKELAGIYLKKGDLKIALQEALEAYKTDKQLTMPYYRVEITDLLSRIYAAGGNTNKAYSFLLENQRAVDSAMNRDILSQIAVSAAQYNFEKKENRFNKELEEGKRKRNMAFILMGVFALLILLGSYFYYTLRRERRKSENLLLNILPASTAEELKKFGRTIPTRHESVTIMFCDVKSFTKISEKLSPEMLVNMLDLYFSAFDEIISKYDLEKIKTIGDAYMCAGGLNRNQSNHAERVVKAALEILDFVDSSEEDMRHKFGNAFSLRIGIHTGPAVSGVVGSKKYAYDIWGDTVNIAARMEQTSEAGRINISESTRLQIEGLYRTEYRGKLSAKNKSEMDMYFILRPE